MTGNELRDRILQLVQKYPGIDATTIASNLRPYPRGWRSTLEQMIRDGLVEHVVQPSTTSKGRHMHKVGHQLTAQGYTAVPRPLAAAV